MMQALVVKKEKKRKTAECYVMKWKQDCYVAKELISWPTPYVPKNCSPMVSFSLRSL